ncbi:DUF1329 domain-containing protein [Candidatus Binatus sp.]|uniref:DUF1329 domain-containing protein n=1 Tax=Candidatus Binatus sp. TaxID=2811406 RepID=UPI00272C6C6B|nr:DUF1329 domain-containing protein [Candidatus Binatus sp.]
MMTRFVAIFATALALLSFAAAPVRAQVKPGDFITKDNAAKVQNLVSPGNYVLVQNGMTMKVIATSKLDWPPPFKTATEKYSPQVKLDANGELKNYVSGQPFPLLDPNDPQMATKVMWNFSYRPLYSDDIDMRFPEVASFDKNAAGAPLSFFTVGHFAFYNNIGRIEVPPVPTDPDAAQSGVRYRFGYYPFLEPSGLRGYGLLRFRHIDPKIEDNVWVFNPSSRRLRRQSAAALSDAIGALPGFAGAGGGGGQASAGFSSGGGGSAFASTLDPDSYFGFSAKIEDYSYKFLGEREMLASVHAEHSPEVQCPTDGGKTICPENWELRHVYVIEADIKPGVDATIPKRVLYIDSEGWFITASDQYDREGKLWKTLTTFHTYRDRPVPDAKIAIYPYKRMFQLGLVDYDLQTGFSSVVYMPGATAPDRECWYIDMGTVDNAFFSPQALQNSGH